MLGKQRRDELHNIINSKFVRTISLRIVSVFLIILIAIITIVFFSFTTEINKNIISERQKQLEVIESTLSRRIEEMASISYNIGEDKSFYLNTIESGDYTGYEMYKSLGRYMAGNDFIEHLAYYRISEPDVIYTSAGELSFHDFWCSSMNLDDQTATELVNKISAQNTAILSYIPLGDEKKSYFSYLYPLPQFSEHPQAFVLMLFPLSKVKPILETQLTNCSGEIAIFDTAGEELYHLSNLDEQFDIDLNFVEKNDSFEQNGKKYIVQKVTSESNGFTYVSIIRINDIISPIASRQLIFIGLTLLLMILAVFFMLYFIVVQYKPINNLAMTLTDTGTDGKKKLIDEESVLADTLTILKDDSKQKQKFEAAYMEATAANKEKSAFLSNMSHDIRTPMNAIVGMTEIAIDHTDEPEYVKECLQNVRVASQYLLDIINNILDMSRIESGRFSLSEDVVNLPKLIYNILTILNHSIDVKSQKLFVEIENVQDEEFIGDSVRITQVFMNILSNAVKFTPNGGSIKLQIKQTPSSDQGYGDYTFTFSDTGIGMSPDFIKQVFETFTRDSNTNLSRIEGTGLGMAISKNLIDLMGGTIECQSELGKGSVFTVRLHMKLNEKQSVGEMLDQYQGISVLILDNPYHDSMSQIKLFKDLGVQTDQAENVASAIEKLSYAKNEGTPYDFFIINQSEDDKSGIETIRKLLNKDETSQTTYVLAARDLLAVDKSHAYENGISMFVQNPLFKGVALGILNRTIKLHNHQEKDDIVNMEGHRILLVEDNVMNRKVAINILKETGAEIYEAVDGKEAVKAFKEHEVGFFDIILMDIQMPEMNGYEATMAIRSVQREDATTIPIYAMTANTFDEDVRQVKEAGMNGHLGKPYVSAELFMILEKAVK